MEPNNIDAQMAEMERQMAEMKRKMEDLAKKKIELETPLSVTFTRFSKSTGTIYLRLSKYDAATVETFRRYSSRRFSGEENYFAGTDTPQLIKDFEARNLPITWADGVREAYEEWNNLPDIRIGLSDKGKTLTLKLGPKVSAQNLWLNDLQSLTFVYSAKHYTLALAEAYKLPTSIESRYPRWKIEYEDDAKDIIYKQIHKRQAVAEIAVANNCEYPNPFSHSESFDFKPHQRVAARFAELTDCKCIIGYDMGLGKSPIAIGLSEKNQFKKVLIICPASLKTNWRREVKKFTGKDAFVLSGIEPDEVQMDLVLKREGYFIINYDILARGIREDKENNVVTSQFSMWATLINMAKFDIVFIDEAHYAKNLDSKRSVAVRQLDVPRIIPMSGTPLVNRRSELFVLLHLIDKQAFPSFAQFENIAVRGDKALRDLLASYMIRRSFADIYGKELEPNRITITKELSPKARAHYNKIMEGVYISVRRPDVAYNINSVLAELMRMKQTVSLDNCETTADRAVDAADETEKKVLIFSQFKDSQYEIARRLGNECEVINGDVTDDARYATVDKFQDPNSSLKFVVTNILEGLTLTAAHTVFFNDYWWTPKDHRQAEGRAFGRVNDPHSGNSYYIQNEDTIDEFLIMLLHRKMELFSSIIDGTATSQMEQGDMFKELINHLKGQIG